MQELSAEVLKEQEVLAFAHQPGLEYFDGDGRILRCRDGVRGFAFTGHSRLSTRVSFREFHRVTRTSRPVLDRCGLRAAREQSPPGKPRSPAEALRRREFPDRMASVHRVGCAPGG